MIISQIHRLIDYIYAGGIVMIPLLLISIGMWSLIVERLLTLRYYRNILLTHKLDKETRLSIYIRLDQYIPIIKILSSIAPLLGLLGTVIGMIKTFGIIAYFGTGDPKLMASGISEALITTQTGLIIAIPGIYMSRFLEKRAQFLKQIKA